MTIEGGCHCGNIRYSLLWPADGHPPTRLRCQCDFCQRHGASWTSHPDARLQVRTTDPALVIEYRFGHGTACFKACRTCGVLCYATSEQTGEALAVVRTCTFETLEPSALAEVETDFDGEAGDERLGRRARNWMPVVQEPVRA